DLGLSLVHRVVVSRGGSVEVVPNHPQGSRFVVRLPAVRPGSDAGRTPTGGSDAAVVGVLTGADSDDDRASATG
ncbi:MAG: hypothetical protein SNJ61_10460, partial [Fimbriimonadaceae bacterium]